MEMKDNHLTLSDSINSCQFYADTMELWCDDSNLTEIPHPETVEGRFAPVIYTRTIFMNHSCIKTIDTGKGNISARNSAMNIMNMWSKLFVRK